VKRRKKQGWKKRGGEKGRERREVGMKGGRDVPCIKSRRGERGIVEGEDAGSGGREKGEEDEDEGEQGEEGHG